MRGEQPEAAIGAVTNDVLVRCECLHGSAEVPGLDLRRICAQQQGGVEPRQQAFGHAPHAGAEIAFALVDHRQRGPCRVLQRGSLGHGPMRRQRRHVALSPACHGGNRRCAEQMELPCGVSADGAGQARLQWRMPGGLDEDRDAQSQGHERRAS